MRRYLKLYLLFAKYAYIRAMMYKENFITWSLVTVGWFILNLLFYQFIYLNVDIIAGWQKHEVYMVLGFYFLFDFLLWGILWQNMRQIPEKINKGTLDLELTKPINQQFLLSFKHIGNDDFNSLIFGLGTIIYALRLGSIQPTLLEVILGFASVILAFIYVYSAWFTTMCAAFWFERIDNLHFLFPGLRHFWRVPQPFYKGLLRGFLTFVIPATLITTVPAQILLRKPSMLLFATLIFFAIFSLLFSSWFFKIAIKRYGSASS